MKAPPAERGCVKQGGEREVVWPRYREEPNGLRWKICPGWRLHAACHDFRPVRMKWCVQGEGSRAGERRSNPCRWGSPADRRLGQDLDAVACMAAGDGTGRRGQQCAA